MAERPGRNGALSEADRTALVGALSRIEDELGSIGAWLAADGDLRTRRLIREAGDAVGAACWSVLKEP